MTPWRASTPSVIWPERMRLFRELEGEIREVQGDRGSSIIFIPVHELRPGETFSRRIDITEMTAAEDRLRASQRRIEEIAFTDSTTGLPNRMRFREVVDDLIHRGRSGFAVMLINLDRFRTINDGLGDAAGDALLAAVGVRLRGCVDQLRCGGPAGQRRVRLIA